MGQPQWNLLKPLLQRSTALIKLDVSSSPTKFTGLEDLSSLEVVNLSSTIITRKVLSTLPVSLIDLSLGCSNIVDANLLLLKRLQNLTKLRLYSCSKITDVGVSNLILVTPGLRDLDLSGTRITNQSLLYLQHLQIRTLYVSDCSNITDTGLLYLAEGVEGVCRNQFTYLEISECYENLSDGIAQLRQLLPSLVIELNQGYL